MYSIEYYSTRLYKEIENWPVGIAASYARISRLIIDHGPNLGMPHTEALDKGLFEIRAKGKEGIGRVLFCTVVGRKVYVLHAIIKKTNKIPKKDLDLARKRMKEVKSYYVETT